MSSKRTQWQTKKNDNIISSKRIIKRDNVQDHPLRKFVMKIESKGYVGKVHNSSSDPLNVIMDGDDPLSLFQKNLKIAEDEDDYLESKNEFVSKLQPWSVRKEQILSKYSSTDMLTMTNYFSLQERGTSALRPKSELMDNFEEGIKYEINDISPQDYCKRMEILKKEMIKAWNEDQKVKALKIVIQCSKLLSDTNSVNFYPCKFVYITDILDTFGQLLYTRLKSKADVITHRADGTERIKKLPDNFTSDMVPETAKETCRNWFYKIASIRELIPRLYVEAAIVNSYTFITEGETGKVLWRLTKMARGVGDAIVCVYARCYICRIAIQFNVTDFDLFKENFQELLTIYPQIYNLNMHLNRRIDINDYLICFTPALNWILQGLLAYDSKIKNEIFNISKEKSNNSLLLYSILTSYDSDFIISNEMEILNWISSLNEVAGISCDKLLELLGDVYQKTHQKSSIKASTKSIILIWRMLSSIQNLNSYLTCVELYISATVACLPSDKVNIIIGNVIKHVTNNNNNGEHNIMDNRCYQLLEMITKNITESIDDIMSLFKLDNFIPLIGMFQHEVIKISVCKSILQVLMKRNDDVINDTIALNSIMFVASILHDSINAFTVDDEKRQISIAISCFIKRVYFENDYEQLLSFYVEARGYFHNLDYVHVSLIQCVNKMAMDVFKSELRSGNRISNLNSFVRACAAYSFITIPSLNSDISKIQLYLLSGQVALATQCIPQAECCFKSILDLIPDFSSTDRESTEEAFKSYIKLFLSLLLIVPDNPDEGSMNLLRTLINVLDQYKWNNKEYKCQLYIDALHVASVAALPHYPYHINKVDSNDVLYGSDENFLSDLNAIATVILNQILKCLQDFGSSGDLKIQANLSMDLFNCLMIRGDVSSPDIAKLALNLWNLSKKNKCINESKAVNAVNYYKNTILDPEDAVLSLLFSKLQFNN